MVSEDRSNACHELIMFHRPSGSDRHDIHLHKERPPVVKDLMEEVEKKARVTEKNQQLIFRGKSLSRRIILATFSVKVNGYI